MHAPRLTVSTVIALLAGVALLVALATCTYGHKRFATQPLRDVRFSLHTLQVDDYGTFWEPDAAQTVLDQVASATEGRNAVVLLYIHGWHHNASPDDSNLKGFKVTLNELTALLDRPLYVQSRRTLTQQDAISVIGIYIGWRGRSLPGFLDYLTLWPRKATAERVGSGDLREFLARLDRLYAVDRNQPGGPFMGLVATGHSLGGQVLFRAVSEALEAQLIAATPRRRFDTPGSEHSPSGPVPQPQLRAIGDITVLLNPALEAYQFDRLHRLSTRLSYNCFQTPTLVVISGEDDSARQAAFPIARSLTRIFRPPFRETQKALWRTALGEYEPQRTHTLELSSAATTLVAENYLTPAQVLGTDFTSRTVIGGAELVPIAPRAIPFRPIVVAYSSRKLIQGHSGIFTDTFRQFLTDYVAFIEGKRMLMRSPAAASFVCPGN